MSNKSPLRLLGDIINQSIEIIESRLSDGGVELPSLDQPYDPSLKVESILLENDIIRTKKLIVAAASQLMATVRHPVETVIDYGQLMHIPQALRAASESNIVEIVRDAGPAGIHVDDIVKKSNTDPLKTSRILRLLANQFVFKELSPNVFAANRLSSVVDTQKSVPDLTADPIKKYNNTSGIAAFINMIADEVGKASSYLPENFVDPKLSRSDNPADTPFNLAIKENFPLFHWFEKPGHEHRLVRFGIAMRGTTQMEPADGILQGFKWQNLPKDSIVIDVGGGVGSSSLIVAKANPHLKIIIQDRQAVTKDAEAFWRLSYPEALYSGRVIFQAHDFFTPQPEHPADTPSITYLLRFVTHNWTDRLASQILGSIRSTARADSKIVIVETIVPYICKASIEEEIPGAKMPDAPEPLLPSLGAANNMSFWWDMMMYNSCNAQDRTLGQFVALAAASGWKVVQVHRIPGSFFSQYVAIPI